MATVLTRRTFLVRAGRGSLALAVVGLTGCVPATSGSVRPASSGVPSPSPETSTQASATSAGQASAEAPSGSDGVAWERVELGIVSAYVLVRGGEAAVVDTGVRGSEGDIAAALERLGLDWGAVGHVILTHKHADHAGSIDGVLAAAPDATGYAGTADLPAISADRPLTALEDGDTVFDLQVLATPGHTPGHIAVLDPVNGVLVAGDALNTAAGTVTGPNPQFSEDMTTAAASVARLGSLAFGTLLVGHGDPITSGASTLVAALAAGG